MAWARPPTSRPNCKERKPLFMSLQFERPAKSAALKYDHILSAFSRAVWAILPEKFAVIQSFLQLKASGGTVSAEQLALVKRPARRPYLLDLTDRKSTRLNSS